MEKEIWKPVVGEEGRYEASSLGRVRSLDRWIYVDGKKGKYKYFKRGGLLNPVERKTSANYTQIVVSISHHYRTLSRVIAEAFIPNPDNKPEVEHINTDTSDNRVCNLKWVTSEENHKNPLTRQHMSEVRKGHTPWNKGKKYTEEQCSNISKSLIGKYTYDRNPNSKAVLQFSLNGDFIREFSCIKEACECLGVNQPLISMCCRGKCKSAYGYLWKYKEVV